MPSRQAELFSTNGGEGCARFFWQHQPIPSNALPDAALAWTAEELIRGDGSVRSISEHINFDTDKALGTRMGSETLGEF